MPRPLKICRVFPHYFKMGRQVRVHWAVSSATQILLSGLRKNERYPLYPPVKTLMDLHLHGLSDVHEASLLCFCDKNMKLASLFLLLLVYKFPFLFFILGWGRSNVRDYRSILNGIDELWTRESDKKSEYTSIIYDISGYIKNKKESSGNSYSTRCAYAIFHEQENPS